MEQIVMKVFPTAAGIFRDGVLLGILIVLWKIIVAKMPDLYDKVLFAVTGMALVAANLAGIHAAIRFPVIGIGIIIYCICRRKGSVPQMAFLLLLLYNIHALTYLISVCFYDWLNEIIISYNPEDVTEQFFLEWLYRRLAVTQAALMLTYALLVILVLLVFKKVGTGRFEMGMRDFCFLSVLNVVGIIFVYMILKISFVKLENEVFMLFDNRRDALWKVPLMSVLMLAGELSSIYVWQKYRALMAEKENVLIYEGKLKQMKERLDEADSFYGNIRALKHDIRNHLSNIRHLYAKGDYEDAGAYIARIDRALDEMDYRFSTGNTVCDVIVNDKYRVCAREQIDFSSDFTFYDRAGVASFDMGIILSNLLDNAIEACRKLDEGKRFITLKSKIKGAFVLLEVSNSYTGEITFDEEHLPVSTKNLPETAPAAPGGNRSARIETAEGHSAAHGIGLRSSRRVAEKYLGNLKIEKTDDCFTVVVMMQTNCPVDTL